MTDDEQSEQRLKEYERARELIKQAYELYKTETMGLHSFLDYVITSIEGEQIGVQGLCDIYFDKIGELSEFYDALDEAQSGRVEDELDLDLLDEEEPKGK